MTGHYERAWWGDGEELEYFEDCAGEMDADEYAYYKSMFVEDDWSSYSSGEKLGSFAAGIGVYAMAFVASVACVAGFKSAVIDPHNLSYWRGDLKDAEQHQVAYEPDIQKAQAHVKEAEADVSRSFGEVMEDSIVDTLIVDASLIGGVMLLGAASRGGY